MADSDLVADGVFGDCVVLFAVFAGDAEVVDCE